jgi:hypothetical protein
VGIRYDVLEESLIGKLNATTLFYIFYKLAIVQGHCQTLAEQAQQDDEGLEGLEADRTGRDTARRSLGAKSRGQPRRARTA